MHTDIIVTDPSTGSFAHFDFQNADIDLIDIRWIGVVNGAVHQEHMGTYSSKEANSVITKRIRQGHIVNSGEDALEMAIYDLEDYLEFAISELQMAQLNEF